MTTPPKDGGPAFPKAGHNEQGCGQTMGMSLRDWFAGMALSAHIRAAIELAEKSGGEEIRTGPMVAESCYKISDDMLAERNKP